MNTYSEIYCKKEYSTVVISYKESSKDYKIIESNIINICSEYGVCKAKVSSSLCHVLNMVRRNHSIAYSSADNVKIYVRNYSAYYKVTIVIA